jgi:hypothetical protein
VRVTDAGHRFTMLNAEPADRQSTQCAPRRRLKDETGAMMAIDTLFEPGSAYAPAGRKRIFLAQPIEAIRSLR